MIIPNVNATQSAAPTRLVSNDAPRVAATSAAAVPAQQPSVQQLATAVENINQAMRQSKLNLELSVDSESKTPIVKMTDTQTGELIRQFPSESVLAIAHSIDQFLAQHRFQQGLLLKQKA